VPLESEVTNLRAVSTQKHAQVDVDNIRLLQHWREKREESGERREERGE
jgi:hypothetical protein